jgi:hypothetical protein
VRSAGTAVRLLSGGVGRQSKGLSHWAFNQMLIGVATRKYARSVRLPDGDLAGEAKRATTKSSVSRRFVALSTAKLKEWLAADLSGLDLLVIQIDRLRVATMCWWQRSASTEPATNTISPKLPKSC